jgi:Ca2+-binding EF-hand superfamily protein
MFEKYDKNKSGFIDATEFKQFCYDLGHSLTEEQCALALLTLDRNKDGQIAYDEFLAWWRTEVSSQGINLNSSKFFLSGPI